MEERTTFLDVCQKIIERRLPTFSALVVLDLILFCVYNVGIWLEICVNSFAKDQTLRINNKKQLAYNILNIIIIMSSSQKELLLLLLTKNNCLQK